MTRVRDGLTSVVVVAADSGPALRQSIDRVLASTSAIEVILVDNASGDGEPMRAKERHADDPRLVLLTNAANRGFGPACNQGAAASTGDATGAPLSPSSRSSAVATDVAISSWIANRSPGARS